LNEVLEFKPHDIEHDAASSRVNLWKTQELPLIHGLRAVTIHVLEGAHTPFPLV